jgi:glycerol kinase
MPLKQTQADLISIPVYRPKMRETTALGAAIAAGLAFGIWNSFAELRDINRAGGTVFEPSITQEESANKFGEWQKAVRMSRGWIEDNKTDQSASSVSQAKTNGTHKASVESRDFFLPTLTKSAPSSLLSDIATASGVGATLKVKIRNLNGEEFSPVKTPLISISGHLDNADEDDLLLELRKVEILQKLKKLRKLKLSYY